MNIAIDLGNTFAKVGVFSGRELEDTDRLPVAEVIRLLEEKEPEAMIVSSVNQDPAPLLDAASSGTRCFVLDHGAKVPVTIGYSTPDTLGMDRLAAVVGALEVCPSRNVLVIDAGTCITYDFVDAQGHYHGGSIAPGIRLKFEALHTFTANLPLITRQDSAALIGDSTENAIRSGVINGTIAEIREIIRMYSNKFAHLQIILCGGDAKFLATKLDQAVLVQPHLVLIGLNRILLYNA